MRTCVESMRLQYLLGALAGEKKSASTLRQYDDLVQDVQQTTHDTQRYWTALLLITGCYSAQGAVSRHPFAFRGSGNSFPIRWHRILAELLRAVNGKGVPFAQIEKKWGLNVLNEIQKGRAN